MHTHFTLIQGSFVQYNLKEREKDNLKDLGKAVFQFMNYLSGHCVCYKRLLSEEKIYIKRKTIKTLSS